jgi:hypothetical protein
LLQRGEPAGYLPLHAAALANLVSSPAWPKTEQPADLLGQVHSALQHALTFRSGFLRYGGSQHSLEIGKWWLREDLLPEADKITLPLSDRVEMEVVRNLQKNPGCPFEELDASLCASFPGLLTPDPELIQNCLGSYGVQDPPGSDRWQLRAEDNPQARRADLKVVESALEKIAGRLGFTCQRLSPELPIFAWLEAGGEIRYTFHLQASGLLGKVLANSVSSPARSILVYPGSRAGLIAYKLENDPYLRQLYERGWRLVKFRHVNRLLENMLLSPVNLDELLALDPLTRDDPQIPLL